MENSKGPDPLLSAKRAADDSPEGDQHRSFRDTFLLYGDFNRPTLMQEIAAFVTCASREEVADLQRRLRVRAAALAKMRAPRGRPRSANDLDKQTRALRVFWWRNVERLTWPQIIQRVGLRNTKPNLRTATRWYRSFTEDLDWAIRRFGLGGANETRMKAQLQGRKLQDWLRIKTGLPFDRAPEAAAGAVLHYYFAPREK